MVGAYHIHMPLTASATLLPALSFIACLACLVEWQRRRRLTIAKATRRLTSAGRAAEALCEHLTGFVGAAHARALLDAMRRPPLLVTLRVNTLAASREAVLEQLAALCASGEASGLEGLEPHPSLPDVLQLAVHGPRPLHVLGNVLVVDRGCGEAVLRGADVFGPGVLGCSAALRAGERVSVLFADPTVREEPSLGARTGRSSRPRVSRPAVAPTRAARPSGRRRQRCRGRA